MPISITITDIKNLTKRDIDELTKYLYRTWLQDPPCKVDDPNVIKQELDEDIAPTNEPKPRKKRATAPKGKTHKLILEDIQDTVTAEERLNNPGPTTSLADVEKERIIPLPIDVLDVMAKGTEEITYDGVIAFVLENIREKKLSFDKVQALVARFELPSLNKLDEFPHLIAPFYTALREAVDD